MARLNEPAPPNESIDALKRRFIRQNREIARVNSTQSLRIRNLESEITRLLSENIAFRERAIKSEQEVQRLRCYQQSLEEVGRLKEELELSLQQASSLVTKLGVTSRLAIRGHKPNLGLGGPTQQPSHQGRRNRRMSEDQPATDKELQEGRLPPIVEGKYYPRRSLDTSEVRFSIDDAAILSESPELGPPPIAHFEVPERSIPRMAEADDLTQLNVASVPEKLEKRRKRRVSSLIADMPQSDATTGEDAAVAKTLTPKAGEMRKLNVHEDGDKSIPPSMEEFHFRTKSDAPEPAPALAVSRSRGTRFTKQTTTDIPSSNSTATNAHSRKILAPKSTNSPTKTEREDISIKPTFNGQRRVGGARKNDGSLDKRLNVPMLPITDDVSARASETTGVPDTPKELVFSSPPSTRGSGLSKKEITLTASVEDVLGGSDGRSSRRARGAVSYAEPSLRVKMRRPTKDLAPAVGEQTNGFKQQEQESAVRAGSQDIHASQERRKSRTVSIKQESDLDDPPAWKRPANLQDEPTSPLVSKVARQSPVADIASTQTLGSGLKSLEHSLHNLSIFDGPEASPPDSTDPASGSIRRASRRHSSTVVSSKPRINRDLDNAMIQNARSGTIVNVTEQPPRPSSAAGIRRRNERVGLSRSTSIPELNKAEVEWPTAAKLDTAGHLLSRNERAAARRKSMVVLPAIPCDGS